MANYDILKTSASDVIKTNGKKEITGALLQQTLMAMINSLGSGYQFVGVATPETNPGTPDAKVFYIANGKGTYTNFGGLEVADDEVVVLYWDSLWHKESTGIAGEEMLTELGKEVATKQNALTDTDGGYGQRVAELETGKANLQHHHTVADITDFPELYYDATAFFAPGAYPSDRYEELLEAVKAKKTVYATIDEEGYVSYIFFMSSANHYGSSSRVLLTTIFADGDNLYTNTFVLQQSGMTSLQENITGKSDKAKTLAGYGIADAYTKSEVNALLNGKQDTLTAGNGISIEGNVIGVTVITESESQPNTSLWVNPSEDEETDVTYNRSQIDAMVGAKQDTLQLTVKDNGNIVLSNIQGQSKEFMPATPSGDPMHYTYEAAGAVYNDTGADIVKSTPWADLADDDADKTVIHKVGYWYLNGLGNITNRQIREIYNQTINFGISNNMDEALRRCSARTNFFSFHRGYSTTNMTETFIESYILEVAKVCFDGEFALANAITNFALNGRAIRHFIGIINLSNIKVTDTAKAFKYCNLLKTIKLLGLKMNISFLDSSMLTSKSILYMIQNEAATSAISITLHADAYTRAMANADILTALEAHPNVSLASA